MSQNNKINIEEVIVDLMEARAAVMQPLSSRLSQRVENVFQYSFIESFISKLYDKYKVDREDVQEEMRRRAILMDIHN